MGAIQLGYSIRNTMPYVVKESVLGGNEGQFFR